MADLKSQTPTQTLDVVLTKKTMDKAAGGTLLKVLCDAPASAEDTIPKYAEKQGFEFESVKVEDKGYWELYLKKA
jgi:tRNA 2-thiouridine synthesizing protein A